MLRWNLLVSVVVLVVMSAAAMPPPSPSPVPDRGPNLMALLWVTTGLSFGVVLLRFAQRISRARIGWDDYFMLLAMVGAMFACLILRLTGCRRASLDGPFP